MEVSQLFTTEISPLLRQAGESRFCSLGFVPYSR